MPNTESIGQYCDRIITLYFIGAIEDKLGQIESGKIADIDGQ